MVILEPQNISPQPLSKDTRATFESPTMPPWCSHILRDPTLQPIATPTRKCKASTEDSFVAETLATDRTISAWQSLYRTSPSTLRTTDTSSKDNDTTPVAGELVSLLALGRGMNGHADIAHGGLITAVFDETMGMLVGFHKSLGMSGYTTVMNVKFRKPVPTPGAILCRTWLERRSGGRKLWIRGTIEDGEGGLYAEGESLWIEVPRKTPKL